MLGLLLLGEALFNGVDLSGWVNVNGARDTWCAHDGMIVCSGHPTGVLRTARMYEDFVLELEYRHMQPGGNAGLFVWSDALPARGVPFTRSIEVQVMDGVETADYTSHGDVFSIHGATMVPDRPHPSGWQRCLPSDKRAKPSPEWNHYRVTCRDGTLKLEVNGKEVSGGHSINPRKGYICLESEGSEVHFRNLMIEQLAPTRGDARLAPDLVAAEDEGFVQLAGWKEQPDHWTRQDWVLDYDGQGDHLWSEREFGDFELIADWRWSGPTKPVEVPVVLPDGTTLDERVTIDEAGDSGIYLRGNDKSQVNIWCWPIGSGEVYGYRTDAALPPEVRTAVTPKQAADRPIGEWNRFRVRMVGERLSVNLNGVQVIEDALLPGVPARGPIALQHHGSPIQFANLYVRELDDHPAWVPAPNPDAPERTAEVLTRVPSDAKLVFLGDSITEGWEGAGRATWERLYAPRGALNLGVGGDETANVLWRLQQGQVDGLDPDVVVLMLGTNNIGNAHHSPADVADGMRRVVDELRTRLPRARILLLGVFPRVGHPEVAEVTRRLAALADGEHVVFLDIGARFLEADGSFSPDVMPDGLHLSARGYEIWGEALEPALREL